MPHEQPAVDFTGEMKQRLALFVRCCARFGVGFTEKLDDIKARDDVHGDAEGRSAEVVAGPRRIGTYPDDLGNRLDERVIPRDGAKEGHTVELFGENNHGGYSSVGVWVLNVISSCMAQFLLSVA